MSATFCTICGAIHGPETLCGGTPTFNGVPPTGSPKYPGLSSSVIGVFDTYDRRISDLEQTIQRLEGEAMEARSIIRHAKQLITKNGGNRAELLNGFEKVLSYEPRFALATGSASNAQALSGQPTNSERELADKLADALREIGEGCYGGSWNKVHAALAQHAAMRSGG